MSKRGYLEGLPRKIQERIERAYQSGDLGYGVPIPRDTRPDHTDRLDTLEWMYRLLEASFAVEDELEHEAIATSDPNRRKLAIVAELRRRRNAWLDLIGENESD